ncbi:hypothetical protein D3C73_531570 [compost metagenome]
MDNDQKPIKPEGGQSPPEPPSKANLNHFSSDWFGFGKMFEKLPLQKLSARMAYCMGFDLILLVFILILRVTGQQLLDFPNAWDFRFIVFTSIVVFFVGISDMFKKVK